MIVSLRTLLFRDPAPVFYHKMSKHDNHARFAVYACPVMDKSSLNL
ncbi:MAG: hypothetical protein IJK71_07095 [Clostridia bacterium]|nr:hypothetical protein [Clostridia bacterium]